MDKKKHLLDLKLPLGSLLFFYGILLTGYGLFGDKTVYSKSAGININLTWGVLVLAVGLLFLIFAMRRSPED